MGKRKKGFKKPKGGIDATLQNAVSDEEDVEDKLESFLDDEIDKFNSLREDSLLKKSKKKKQAGQAADDSDSEEEVYPLDLTSDEEGDKNDDEDDQDDEDDDDEDGIDDEDDDILGKPEESGLPDVRAWGKKVKYFHNTDYVDEDFGGFEGHDAENAELEENEAKEIQKRLIAEIDDDDIFGFMPELLQKDTDAKANKSSTTTPTQEILKIDFNKLSSAEKLKLVQRECPEIVTFLNESKEKLKMAIETRDLLLNASNSALKEFYETKYHAILNYCINISYYLYLRAKNPSNCKGHPVIKRVIQFRKLLEEIDNINPKAFEPELPAIDESLEKISNKRKCKKADKIKKSQKRMKIDVEAEEIEILEKLRMKDDREEELEEKDEELTEKRNITYEMKKNKGLTPHRKKEQRNPRVKHREKYRKAKIRRKGQVRAPRKEIERYSGEMTGIKSHVVKSIKIK